PAHLLTDVRVQRAVRAPDLTRRGRAREAVAHREDARRRMAEVRERPARAGLHVGASRQAAPLHGQRNRPVAGVEPGWAARVGAARTTAPRGPAALGTGPEPRLPGRSRPLAAGHHLPGV